MAEPEGVGGDDRDALLPRIGPAGATPPAEPEWVPAPAAAWLPVAVLPPPEPPPAPVAALPVGEVYVVGPDGVPRTAAAPDAGSSGGGRPPAWLLVLGSLVVLALAA